MRMRWLIGLAAAALLLVTGAARAGDPVGRARTGPRHDDGDEQRTGSAEGADHRLDRT